MSNPFAAFSVQIGSAEVVKTCPGRSQTLSLAKTAGGKPRLTSLNEVLSDWFHLAENESGGYQYKTVVKVFKKVEVMLDGCASSNHITEELVIGMLNRAADLGVGPEDKGFPIVRFEKWTYPEYCKGKTAGPFLPNQSLAVFLASNPLAVCHSWKPLSRSPYRRKSRA